MFALYKLIVGVFGDDGQKITEIPTLGTTSDFCFCCLLRYCVQEQSC